MTTVRNQATKTAIREYRELCAIQTQMPEADQWKLGAAIKAAKSRAYVEIEASQVR